MHKNLLSLLAILFLFSTGLAQKKEVKKVKKCFETYKSSILNDKGEKAVQQVDSRTIAYYTDILNKTIHADSAEVNALGIMDKLIVFSIRHRTEKEQILSFDGVSLLEYSIREGMVGKNSVVNNSIGKVIIDGTFAKGQMLVYGEETPVYFHFYKENDAWKLDLTSIFSLGNAAFKNMQEESGKKENEFLLDILEMMTGRKPDATIWNSLL